MKEGEPMASIPADVGATAMPMKTTMDTWLVLNTELSVGLSKLMGTPLYHSNMCHRWKWEVFCAQELIKQRRVSHEEYDTVVMEITKAVMVVFDLDGLEGSISKCWALSRTEWVWYK